MKGAVEKLRWCLQRQPNNPHASTNLQIKEDLGVALFADSATFTLSHESSSLIDVRCSLVAFDSNAAVVFEKDLGILMGIKAGLHELKLPISELPTNAIDAVIVVTCGKDGLDATSTADAQPVQVTR